MQGVLRGLAAVLLASAVLAVAAVPASATDESAWLYEPDRVSEIDFTLTPENRAALDADPDEYVPATFSVTRDDGQEFGPVTTGLKLKGSGSFRTLDGKASFKLKFNEFVKGQKFLGLKKLTLNSMVQDPSMIHEVLSYEAFRAVGLPTWRTGYAFVRLNGDAYGVYLNIETPDSVSLARSFPSTKHLYEGELWVDLVPGGEGAYEVDEGDEDDRSDLTALIDAVTTWTGVEDVADLQEMTRFWAVERYIGHWDGYTGGGPNNYYLHSDADGVFTMLPWGTDQTWFQHRGFLWAGSDMFNACLAHEECKQMYLDAVHDVVYALAEHDLAGLATDTAEMLKPWQDIDPRRETSRANIAAQVASTLEFIATRPADGGYVPPPPPDPPDPPEDDDPPAVDEEPVPPIDTTPRDELPSPSLPQSPLTPVVPHLDTEPAPAPFAVREVRFDGRLLATAVDVPAAGRVALWVSGRVGGEQREICRARPAIAAAGARVVRCRVTSAGRKAIERSGLRVRVYASLRPATGAASSSDAFRVTLRASKRR